jgi:hypothetical protein
MSINRLTSDALKEDFRRAPATDGRGGGYTGPSYMTAEIQREVAAQSNAVTESLESLVKYIPTEAVTLYVATLSAAHLLRSVLPGFDARMIYWAFFLVTPGLFLFVYASKRATDGLKALPSPKEWPWWELFACTLAYAVWGLAVPGNPYVDSALVGAVAAFGAVFISTLLTLAEPIVLRNRTQ